MYTISIDEVMYIHVKETPFCTIPLFEKNIRLWVSKMIFIRSCSYNPIIFRSAIKYLIPRIHRPYLYNIALLILKIVKGNVRSPIQSSTTGTMTNQLLVSEWIGADDKYVLFLCYQLMVAGAVGQSLASAMPRAAEVWL